MSYHQKLKVRAMIQSSVNILPRVNYQPREKLSDWPNQQYSKMMVDLKSPGPESITWKQWDAFALLSNVCLSFFSQTQQQKTIFFRLRYVVYL